MTDPMSDQLVGWGKALLLETVGRRSGASIRTPIGFVEDADGSVLVAAGDPSADWAMNLREHPACRITIGDASVDGEAEELDGPERDGAIRELILKYGTPAERLGSGPAFRLRRGR